MTIRVEGVADFRKELKAVDGKLPREMTKAYRRISNHVLNRARVNATAAAGPFGDRFRAAKSAIKSFASSSSAAVGVSRSGRIPFAQATFWGAKGRSGWYAWGRYRDSTGQQHPDWVGNFWRAGVKGQGPYVLNYTVAEELDEVVDMFGDAMSDLFAAAFND